MSTSVIGSLPIQPPILNDPAALKRVLNASLATLGNETGAQAAAHRPIYIRKSVKQEPPALAERRAVADGARALAQLWKVKK